MKKVKLHPYEPDSGLVHKTTDENPWTTFFVNWTPEQEGRFRQYCWENYIPNDAVEIIEV